MIIIARANRRRQESIRHEIRIIMPKHQRVKSKGFWIKFLSIFWKTVDFSSLKFRISERSDLHSKPTQLNNSRRKPSVNRRSTNHRRYAYWTRTTLWKSKTWQRNWGSQSPTPTKSCSSSIRSWKQKGIWPSQEGSTANILWKSSATTERKGSD